MFLNRKILESGKVFKVASKDMYTGDIDSKEVDLNV